MGLDMANQIFNIGEKVTVQKRFDGIVVGYSASEKTYAVLCEESSCCVNEIITKRYDVCKKHIGKRFWILLPEEMS